MTRRSGTSRTGRNSRRSAKPEPAFGLDEILSSLGQGQRVEGGGWYAVADLVRKHGLHRQTVQKRLQELMRAGRLEVTRTQRTGLDPSRLYWVPIYRLKA